jgi:hypothetical protein
MQGLTLVVTYVAIVSVGMAIAAGMGVATDKINAPISMMVFFAAATFVAVFAWPLAVKITEPAAQRP